ncbi:hypothetical protein [Caballeronia sordidicola]|uniref:hypothetical protein n=1 Tax=Caballeronia sordidicola TaxID=196367 RepID=UPI000AE7290F|nr:hypothetical protein [Caballeronia sordidicola]
MSDVSEEQPVPSAEKKVKSKPRRALPTDRTTFSKQLDILRAYAAASGPEKKAVSNDDVAKIVNIHFGTVSNCNPFFLEVGLLRREKNQNVPADEVFAYAERYKWEPDAAAQKLGPLFANLWFATALIPKLSFRSLSANEAVSFLADEAAAGPEYKEQLVLLLSYLRAAGIITIENGVVAAVDRQVDPLIPLSQQIQRAPLGAAETQPQPLPDPPTQPSPKPDLPASDVHPSIAGLISELPKVGTSWSADEMNGFLDALKSTLKFIYKVKTTNQEGG